MARCQIEEFEVFGLQCFLSGVLDPENVEYLIVTHVEKKHVVVVVVQRFRCQNTWIIVSRPFIQSSLQCMDHRFSIFVIMVCQSARTQEVRTSWRDGHLRDPLQILMYSSGILFWIRI